MSARRPSTSAFTLVEIMVVITLIALLTALAVPAFQKVRAESQDRAVTNNLRQLSVAADHYFLERGVSSVASDVLVGTNATQYIKTMTLAAGETYVTPLVQGNAVTAFGVGGARTVTYAN